MKNNHFQHSPKESVCVVIPNSVIHGSIRYNLECENFHFIIINALFHTALLSYTQHHSFIQYCLLVTYNSLLNLMTSLVYSVV